METAMILNSDLLDIIFENRNKAYGAYDLRKFYDNRLIKSLALMITGVSILSAFTLIPRKKKVEEEKPIITTVYSITEPKEKPKEKEPEKPKEPQQPKEKVATQIFSTPIITTAIEPVRPLQALVDTLAIAAVVQTGKPGAQQLVGDIVDAKGGGGSGQGDAGTAEPVMKPDAPRETADVMPSYPGGIEALRKFLQKNLTNPRDMDDNEQVAVKVRFVVGYDGKLQSFVTVQDGGEEFNKEVIRVLKKMPEWVPGKTSGQNVAVYYTIPVKFVSGN
jgi:protein TonB